MKNHKLFLRQIDRALGLWQPAAQRSKRPSIGWVKTIRKALGMTATQLGKRLGLTRMRIVQLERGEINDAISLRTLKAVAEAMECELIYAIIPKISLTNIIEVRAQQVANNIMKSVSHSMFLEDQGISKEEQKEQLQELIKTLIEKSPQKLWD